MKPADIGPKLIPGGSGCQSRERRDADLPAAAVTFKHQRHITLNLMCRGVVGEGSRVRSNYHNSLPTKYRLNIIDFRGEGKAHFMHSLEIPDLLAGRLAKSTDVDRVCRIQSLVTLSVAFTYCFGKPRYDPFDLLKRLFIDWIRLLGESRHGETEC